MSAALTLVDIGGTPITTIKNALNAKSLITSVLYEDSDCLIFSTPLTAKVIKIKCASSSFAIYYGDAWSSSETITNSVTFAIKHAGTISNIYLIADTTWFFMSCECGSSYCYYGYVGALTNGDVIAAGFASQSAGSYGADSRVVNITQGYQILPLCYYLSFPMVNGSGYLLKMPLIWHNPTTKAIMMNGAAPAETLGLCVSSWYGGDMVTDLGANYYLSGGLGYTTWGGNYGYLAFRTGLLVEFAA